MRPPSLIWPFLAALALAGLARAASPLEWNGPGISPLGPVDDKGRFVIPFRLAEVSFGDAKIPLSAEYFAGDDTISPYLGRGWKLWLLEGFAKPSDDGWWEARLPDGRHIWLKPVPGQPDRFEDLAERWLGRLENGQMTLTHPKGWEVRYRDGRFDRLRDDQGRVFEWVWRDGKVLQIVPTAGGGEPPLRVATAENGAQRGFYLDGRLYELTLAPRPVVAAVANLNAITGEEPAFARWTPPGGESESFRFDTAGDDRIPRLTRTDRKGATRAYTWDAATGRIRTDGGWTFEIKPPPNDKSLPGIYRRNASGAEHFLISDAVAGTSEQKMSGFHGFTTWHTEPGPLHRKVIQLGEFEDGKRVVYQAFEYNERGQIVRVTTPKAVYAYEVDEQGVPLRRTVTRVRTPEQQQQLAEREAALTAALATDAANQQALEELARYYAVELRDGPKALALAAQLASPDVRLQTSLRAISNADNLTFAEKIARLRPLLAEYRAPQEQKEITWEIEEAEARQRSLLNGSGE